MTEDQDKYLPAEMKARMLADEKGLFFNVAKFEHAQRVAKLFAESDLVPKHFQGKVANCLIALNYAERMGLDPFMVIQNLYVVYGRPGLESKLVIALINQSGKYATPLQFEFSGEGDDYGCTAWAVEKKSKATVRGTKVTLRIVKAEGWDKKEGSKWRTIPDLMYRYRAASWFCNTNCPEVKLGLPTVEELHDSAIDLEPNGSGAYADPAEKTKSKMEELKGRLGITEQAPATPAEPTDQPAPPVEDGKQPTMPTPKPNGKRSTKPVEPEQLEKTSEWAVMSDLIRQDRGAYLDGKIKLGLPQGPRTVDDVNRMIVYLESQSTRKPGDE